MKKIKIKITRIVIFLSIITINLRAEYLSKNFENYINNPNLDNPLDFTYDLDELDFEPNYELNNSLNNNLLKLGSSTNSNLNNSLNNNFQELAIEKNSNLNNSLNNSLNDKMDFESTSSPSSYLEPYLDADLEPYNESNLDYNFYIPQLEVNESYGKDTETNPYGLFDIYDFDWNDFITNSEDNSDSISESNSLSDIETPVSSNKPEKLNFNNSELPEISNLKISPTIAKAILKTSKKVNSKGYSKGRSKYSGVKSHKEISQKTSSGIKRGREYSKEDFTKNSKARITNWPEPVEFINLNFGNNSEASEIWQMAKKQKELEDLWDLNFGAKESKTAENNYVPKTTEFFHQINERPEDTSEAANGEAESHMMEHVNCQHCGKLYANKYSLINHIKRKHRDKILHCNYSNCIRTFSDQAQLKAHQRTHIKAIINTCPVCNTDFYNFNSYSDHIFNKHPELRINKCDFPGCTASFVENQNLVKHKLKQHNIKANSQNKI